MSGSFAALCGQEGFTARNEELHSNDKCYKKLDIEFELERPAQS